MYLFIFFIYSYIDCRFLLIAACMAETKVVQEDDCYMGQILREAKLRDKYKKR